MQQCRLGPPTPPLAAGSVRILPMPGCSDDDPGKITPADLLPEVRWLRVLGLEQTIIDEIADAMIEATLNQSTPKPPPPTPPLDDPASETETPQSCCKQ